MRAPTPLVVALAVGIVVTASMVSPTAGAVGTAPLRTDGTPLHRPATTKTVTLAPTSGRETLLTSGIGDCGLVHAASGDLLFTIEPGRAIQPPLVSRPWTVTIYQPSRTVPNGWEAALRTKPEGSDPGPLFANVTARAADVTGTGHESLAIGYRSEGTGEILDVDVVIGTGTGPRVAAHTTLYKGLAQVRAGGLVTYAAAYQAHDANCCPAFIERNEIRYRRGAFYIGATQRLVASRADVPSADLG